MSGAFRMVNDKSVPYKNVKLMFEDEARFGRINRLRSCWCAAGIRPDIPFLQVREYRYAFGAVEPLTGDSFFLVMPECNTVCMNIYLRELSNVNPDDLVIIVCDCAAWHKSQSLEIPDNIMFLYIPPATPELNPIEQVWKELRKNGFKNEFFNSLDKVVDRLCDTVNSLSNDTIKSITGRDWILSMF